MLIAWDGANAGTIGFGKSGLIGSTIARLRFKEPEKYDARFVGIYLRTKFDYLRKTATGATIPHISRPALESISIPEFKLEDQIRIATLLNRVDALIATRKNNLQQLDYFLKSTFLDMFGDPVRNEKEWDTKRLNEIFKIKHGFAFKSDYFSDAGNYVLLTPGNFYEKGGYRDRGEKQKYYTGVIPDGYILSEGDLLVAMTEQAPGLLGSPVIVPESNRFLHNQRLGLIELKIQETSRQYLFHLFNARAIRGKIHSKATGTKVRHTSPTKIEEINIGFPPFELQNEFTSIVEKITVVVTNYQKNLIELENLYGTISQRAFKGELDLSHVPLPEEPDPIAHDEKPTGQGVVINEILRMVEYPMSDPDEREKLLHSLLDNYLKEQQGGKMFSLDDFWQQADFKVLDELDESDQSWDVKDYDQVKDWLFELIRERKLEQAFVEDSGEIRDSQIELTVKG
ncbi:MAG: hypothetical protein BMS9Abin36_1954 [Gammaproteobacteria bacterium]|nr:MAG: hypothetical protein BMS9Abin36_1954 [Gammaproteobacteria bacterium]